MHHICPLCRSTELHQICEAHLKPYLQCDTCHLVFVPPEYHLDPTQEKAIYDQHENNPNDPGYRNFLNRLMSPLLAYLNPGSNGLDFGSGPGPTLSLMLQEQGHIMAIYDPYYADVKIALKQRYDFITSTEVVEHLSKPKEVFKQLFELIDHKGVLGIMTKLIPKDIPFEKWHYIKDPTHITFYSEETCRFIAQQYCYRAEIIGNDVILFLPD